MEMEIRLIAFIFTLFFLMTIDGISLPGEEGRDWRSKYPYEVETTRMCWQCFSSKSWDDCPPFEPKPCEGDSTTCGYIYTKQGNVRSHYRGCYSREFCERKSLCNDPKLHQCVVECCEGENCNNKDKPNGMSAGTKETNSTSTSNN